MIWLWNFSFTGWIINVWVPNLLPKTHEGVKIPKLMFQKAPRAPRVSRMPEVHCFERPYQYLWHYERSGCILWVLKTPSAPQTPKTHSKLFSTDNPTDASDCVLDCNQKYPSSENNYYKWFSILFWPLFTKLCLKNPVFQVPTTPCLNFLLTNITYKWLPYSCIYFSLCSAECSLFHKSFPIQSMEKISNI